MGSEAEKDDVLAQIGEHVRSEQKDDARFERVARREASANELAELERAASSDPQVAVRLDASRPLDPKVIEAIASRLSEQEQSASEKKSAGEKKSDATGWLGRSPKTPTVGKHEHAKVIRPAVWRRRFVTIAGPLALAAALVLFITTSRGPADPELPIYVVTASGEQAMRGPAQAEPGGRLRLGKGAAGKEGRFEIVLRPATAPIAKVVAYAFTVGSEPGSDPTPLDAKVEIAEEGSVRITGSPRMLEGAREIRVVVGAPTAIGKFDDAARRAKGGAAAGDAQVRVLSVAIDRE